jgi:immunity protein 8 of polymorphic toxin system
VAVRARVAGWHHPSVVSLAQDGGGREIPQGVIPTPEEPQRFTLEVADAERSGGEDYFEFDVQTPDTLAHLLEMRGALFGRGQIVVLDRYDPERVGETLRPLVESVEAESWEEAAFRIGSLGRWEFEGWKWYPEEERLRQHPGVEAEVREVRLLRTALGESFSLPIEVRFGGTGVEDELTVPMVLQSPLWVRNHMAGDEVVVGSGRVFATRPDGEAIHAALVETSPVARAPSWDLLRLTLRPLEAPGT